MGLRKKLKQLFGKKTEYPTENGVTFIHHNPDRGNIGDLLCSPRHYFTFEPAKKDLYIIGGGVFVGLAVEKLKQKKIPFSNAILWGVGQSHRDIDTAHQKVSDLPYLAWGIRDKDLTTKSQDFLPCVSCLHPMLNHHSEGSGTLLFLNADPKVTAQNTRNECESFAKERSWKLLFNNCNEQEIKSALTTSEHVITNSYHGAYWGLLSGKKVTLLGYSSKFISLLTNFGFESFHLQRVSRGEASSLIETLKNIHDDRFSVQLEDSQAQLRKYQEINIRFADSLIDIHAIEGYKMK